MGNILDSVISGNYIDSEKILSKKNTEQINFYKKTFPTQNTEADQTAWRNNVKELLNEIISIMRTNRDEINKRVKYLEESEVILKEEVEKFKENNTIKELQTKKINNVIMNIANVNFAEMNAGRLELEYRLGIIAYKKLSFKSELRSIDLEIKQVQNYIDAL